MIDLGGVASELAFGSLLFALLVVLLALWVLGMRRLLLPRRHCVVSVNSAVELPAMTFQKLLPLLTDAGIAIPSTCGGAGTCGLCRVKIVRGGGEASSAELGRLHPDDVRAGVRLACQVTVREDLAVELPDELIHAATYSCTVRSRRTVTPFIAEVVLDLPEDAEMETPAGAFVQVTAPAYSLHFRDIEVSPSHRETWDQYGLRTLSVETSEPVTRAYSLANRPEDTGIVLAVRLALPPPGKRVPPGIVSSYLFGIEPGTAIDVSGPFGSFGVNRSDREMVFIGGGAGMAPLRAMIFDQLERVGTSRKMTFWYGARSRLELFYAEELDRLACEHDNFSWTPALSEPRPDDAWDGPTGFIHEVVQRDYLAHHPAPERCEYYLCGPPLMAQAVLAMLDDLGVDRSHVFNDDFGGY